MRDLESMSACRSREKRTASYVFHPASTLHNPYLDVTVFSPAFTFSLGSAQVLFLIFISLNRTRLSLPLLPKPPYWVREASARNKLQLLISHYVTALFIIRTLISPSDTAHDLRIPLHRHRLPPISLPSHTVPSLTLII